MAEIEKLVTDLVGPIAEQRNLELVDVEYVKEGSSFYLRIYLDQENGIDIEEIATTSEIISEKLDELNPDPFPVPYLLEVSSPGLERPIKTEKDWQKALNEYVHLKLYQKQDGQKIFEGKLISYDDEKITLQIKIKTRTKDVQILRNNVASIRFAIEF